MQGSYALIKGGKVVNKIEADSTFTETIKHEYEHVVYLDNLSADNQPGIGDDYDGNKFYKQPVEVIPVEEAKVNTSMPLVKFMTRLTTKERISIRRLSKENDYVFDFYDLLMRTSNPDLADPLMIKGIRYIQQILPLDEGRADQILDINFTLLTE